MKQLMKVSKNVWISPVDNVWITFSFLWITLLHKKKRVIHRVIHTFLWITFFDLVIKSDNEKKRIKKWQKTESYPQYLTKNLSTLFTLLNTYFSFFVDNFLSD